MAYDGLFSPPEPYPDAFKKKTWADGRNDGGSILSDGAKVGSVYREVYGLLDRELQRCQTEMLHEAVDALRGSPAD